jgi:hypothetical protein
MEKCVYGCGQKAKFTMKNGKNCCSKHHNSCPAVKKKMSDGNRIAHQSGVKKFSKSAQAQADQGSLVFDEILVSEPMKISAK